MGYNAGYGLTTGGDNILLGFQAGDSLTTGTGNIIIGYDQDAPGPSVNSFMNIGGAIYGDLSTGRIGIGTASPSYRLVVDGAAGDAGTIVQVSTGGSNLITMNGNGDIAARKYYGDGSGLTGVAGDNLGDHTGTQVLQMGAFGVNTSSAVNAGYYQIAGSTVLTLTSSNGSLGVGVQAGRVNIGNNNAFVGYQAGYANTSGIDNTFLGNTAGNQNTTGNYNSFLGFQAGYSNTIGEYNTFVGAQAGNTNNGVNNTFLGAAAGYNNTTGGNNLFAGRYAGLSNKTGSANAIFGTEAGYGVTNNSFSSSTIMGYQAGYALTTGGDNILLGFKAGDSLTTGTGNIIIGYDQDAPGPSVNSFMNIGGMIYGDLSTGRVGIGTNAPTEKLSVQGAGTSHVLFVSTDAAGGSANFVVNNAGQVGIGTASPAARLEVRGDVLPGVYTAVEIAVRAPGAPGGIIVCADCAGNEYGVCVATGTQSGAYVNVSRTACQ